MIAPPTFIASHTAERKTWLVTINCYVDAAQPLRLWELYAMHGELTILNRAQNP